MISDTVVLSLRYDPQQIKIIRNNCFDDKARIILSDQRVSFIKSTCNSNILMKTKEYFPAITLFKGIGNGGFQIWLELQFSTNKLIYGNNFDEADESDFSDICLKLVEKCKKLGVVFINVDIIRFAEVKLIHYGKNILLSDGTLPIEIIQEVEKVFKSKNLITRRTEYENDGNAVRFHQNNFEAIFYDKVADYDIWKRSCKKSIEKEGFNNVQLSLFKRKDIFEVIRFEVRLNNKKKILNSLNRLNFNYNFKEKDLYFEKLYSKTISKAILIEELKELIKNYPKYNCSNNNFEQIFIQLRKIFPKMSIASKCQLTVFLELQKKYGFESACQIMCLNKDNRIKFKKNALILNNKMNIESRLDKLLKLLNEYKSLKLSDFE